MGLMKRKQHNAHTKKALKQISTAAASESKSSPSWNDLVERVRRSPPLKLFRQKFAEHSKRRRLSSRDDLDVAFIDEDPTKNTIVIATDESVDHSNQSSPRVRANDSYFRNYENVYTTFYMKSRIKAIATEKALDFTITEYLPQKHLDYLEQQEALLIPNCVCCLCRLRTKSMAAHEFCIKMHPYESSCAGDASKRTAQLKYQPAQQSICDECIEVMTSKAKKIKGTKRFGCCFESCDQTGLTKTALKNHCFEHLDVKKFKCTLCDFSHDRKPAIRKHERNH